MNREYKFKAWLKQEKKMVEPWSINLEKQRILFNEPSDEQWTEVRIVSFDDIELLQYTCLKDKNGVEIYEGDVVMDEKGRKFIIEYKFGGFNVVPIDCYNDEFSWNPLGDMQCAGWLTECAEVIDTIYEYKEFLENE